MNTAELRRLAEAAIEATRKIKQNPREFLLYAKEFRDYRFAANPAAMLELLDLIDDQTKDILHYHNESKGLKAKLTAAESVCEALDAHEKENKGIAHNWDCDITGERLPCSCAAEPLEKALREWRKAKEGQG